METIIILIDTVNLELYNSHFNRFAGIGDVHIYNLYIDESEKIYKLPINCSAKNTLAIINDN